MSRAFEALRNGSCANPDCGTGVIREGEQARFPNATGREIVHVQCPADPAPPTVCPSCFMALPATGRCDNCD